MKGARLITALIVGGALLATLPGCGRPMPDASPGSDEAARPPGAHRGAAADSAGTHARPGPTPQIVEIYGDDLLDVGELGQFWAWVSYGSAKPLQYEWSLGDGTQATGNGISHRYEWPGRYTVVATVGNEDGTDTDTLLVTVSGPAPPPPSTPPQADGQTPAAERREEDTRRTDTTSRRSPALYGAQGVDASAGGYTWVVATHLRRDQAEQEVQRYRALGYRAGVYVDDDGPGSTAFRVVIGQFATTDEALAARRILSGDVRLGMWLLELAK